MPEPSRTTAKLVRAAAATLVAAAFAMVVTLFGAAPAAAADVFIEVNPSTVEAGNQVGIRASCPDNNVAATARSDAFGQLTLAPRDGFLVATIRVPAERRAATYPVRLTCPDGSQATVTLYVVSKNRPTQGPATGFGGTAGSGAGRLLVVGGLIALLAGAGLGIFTLRRSRLG